MGLQKECVGRSSTVLTSGEKRKLKERSAIPSNGNLIRVRVTSEKRLQEEELFRQVPKNKRQNNKGGKGIAR